MSSLPVQLCVLVFDSLQLTQPPALQQLPGYTWNAPVSSSCQSLMESSTCPAETTETETCTPSFAAWWWNFTNILKVIPTSVGIIGPNKTGCSDKPAKLLWYWFVEHWNNWFTVFLKISCYPTLTATEFYVTNCLFFNLTNNLKNSLVHVKWYLLLLKCCFWTFGNFCTIFKSAQELSSGGLWCWAMRKLCWNNTGPLHRLSCVKVQGKGVLWTGPWVERVMCALGWCSVTLLGSMLIPAKPGKWKKILWTSSQDNGELFQQNKPTSSFLLFLW